MSRPFLDGLLEFIRWLGGFAEDGKSGHQSSKRVIALMAGTAMSIGLLALLLARAWWIYNHGGDIALEIAAVTMPLCTLAGYGAYLTTAKKPLDSQEPEPQKQGSSAGD